MQYLAADPRRIFMRSIKSLAALSGAALCLAAGAGAALAASEEAQPGVWTHHQASTAWFGQTSHYTCPGLEETLKHVLLYLGARPDLQVTASCPDPITPVRTAVVKTDFYTLQPASSGAGDTVSGRWVAVRLTAQSPSQYPYLGTGECELLYQFKDLLSKSFSFRDLKYQTSCFPHSVTLLDYSIRGQVLQPEAQPKSVAQR
jgi:hypothetical protein